ncbi:MAG: DUF6496 domain-containing protein [Bacteroidales bacterium]|jgi:hypothetical protein
MAKYSKKAQNKIEEVMHEFKEGTLKSSKIGNKILDDASELLNLK